MDISRIFFPTLSCQCSVFRMKNPVIQIFCISGLLAIPIIPDNWSYTVLVFVTADLLLQTL
jgi:hypothetical protein